MRIVADTNTVISGLLYGGHPQEIINAARAKRITLYSSVTLIAELAEVIVREKFARQIRAARVSAPKVVADYAQLARIVVPAEIRSAVAGGPYDDEVLACALAAQAEHMLVTRYTSSAAKYSTESGVERPMSPTIMPFFGFIG